MDFTKFSIDSLWLMIDTCNNNDVLKNRCEEEMQSRIPSKYKYSIEYLFSVTVKGRRPLTVYFKPFSVSHIQYGRKIVIFDLVLEEEEAKEIEGNYATKPPIRTVGQIKCRLVNFDGITPKQKEELLKVGFNTSDILHCEYEE